MQRRSGTDTDMVEADGSNGFQVKVAGPSGYGVMDGSFIVSGFGNNSLTIEGDGIFDATGTCYVGFDSDVVINVSRVSGGVFDNNGGTMEFMCPAAADCDVSLTSLNGPSLLKLDKPASFFGQVDLTRGAIDLAGLGKVGSFTFANDILSLYVGNKVVDTLDLVSNAPNGFGVERSGNNLVTVFSVGNNPISHATALPMHT